MGRVKKLDGSADDVHTLRGAVREAETFEQAFEVSVHTGALKSS
jgi:hypothetical protein